MFARRFPAVGCLLPALLGWFTVQAANPQHAVPDAASAQPPARTEAVDPAWSDYRSRFTRQICPFDGDGEYDAAAVQCGYVLVPEDRTDPSSRLIRIAVMRIPSTVEAPEDGALLFLDGGPGLTSIGVGPAGYFSGPGGAPLLGSMDVVFFDQRGIGYSEAAFCRAVPEPYQYGVPLARGTVLYQSRMRQCLQEARQ